MPSTRHSCRSWPNMRRPKPDRHLRGVLLAATLAGLAVTALASQPSAAPASPGAFWHADGSIFVPSAEPARGWTRVGTRRFPDGRGATVHETYASPGAAAAFARTGDLPDGAVILKQVSHQPGGKTSGWFVMIRDHRHRFPGHPLWAEGWGWSWVDASRPSRGTSTSFAADCRSCHAAVQGTRWVHVADYDWRTR